MILRNFPIQWILGIIVVIIILYFKIKLDYLHSQNKLLVDALTRVQNQMKNDEIDRNGHKLLITDDVTVVYNRVPKTGSTSFVGVVYELCKRNKFHTLHINVTNNMHTLTLPNQGNIYSILVKSPNFRANFFIVLVGIKNSKMQRHSNIEHEKQLRRHFDDFNRAEFEFPTNYDISQYSVILNFQIQFVNNITYWDAVKPAFYHGHMAFLNFNKFGMKQTPLYINLLRRPLDRFVSYYYFLRYGDNFRPHLIRKKHGDTKSFDECVKADQPDCDPNNMWLQIPFLCGHDPGCWRVGNKWALEEAKRNLAKHYLLVGVTEELDEFIETLQIVLPRFFRGAYDYFLHSNKSHLRQTTQKINPHAETIKKIHNSTVWKMENELYNFALTHFHSVKKRLINAPSQDMNQHFMYEKIRPK